MSMMKKLVAFAAASLLLVAALFAMLSIRYPNLSTTQAAAYVVHRSSALITQRFFIKTPYDAHSPLNVELRNIRQMIIVQAPQLKGFDKMRKAVYLRNMVYHRVPLKSPPPGFDYANLDRSVYLELFDKNYGDSCGGLAIIYMTMLKAFGIPSRYVAMFSQVRNAPNPVNSHASVDILVNGRWIAEDPTFNFSLQSEGHLLSWQEYRRDKDLGKAISISSNGLPLIQGRAVQNYPVPLPTLARYMILGPTSVSKSALPIFPRSWNGVIKYANGTTFNEKWSLTHDPVYAKLAQVAPISALTTNGRDISNHTTLDH